ncbi:MAG: T9SS type A sorting domain-containing protein [Ignavibacteriaceae bacterium]|nr:T9SS type A sorting domain-containing protein [Ignavibacteriaceae bacterium]
MVSDGTGGAIIAWDDWRNGVTNIDIYAQRINADGIVQWTANGSDISTIGNIQSGSTIVSDGAGGVIIAWLDQRVSPNITDIYAQRINASGNVQWAEDGIAISTASGDQLAPVIDSDDGSGAIITWTDSRNGATNWDIYAQQVSGAGILGSVTSIGEVQNTPLMFSLEQNYPNPFNPSTKISWQSPVGSHQTLKVYDVLGNEVATLVDEYKPAGAYEIEFNAAGLPSGIYFYKLTTGINSKIKKMTLIK